MPLMLLTAQNIEFTKKTLRSQLPEIKSGHMTEAIAASAGYSTHASLLAALSAHTGQWPNLVRLSQSALSARLLELGYRPENLTGLLQISRAADLPQRMYADLKNRHRASHDAWFYECRDRNIPYIFLEKKRIYYRLHWDCISLNSANEDHLHGADGDNRMRIMFRAFQAIAKRVPGDPEFFGSSFTGSVTKVPVEIAHLMADAFFQLLYQPLLHLSEQAA